MITRCRPVAAWNAYWRQRRAQTREFRRAQFGRPRKRIQSSAYTAAGIWSKPLRGRQKIDVRLRGLVSIGRCRMVVKSVHIRVAARSRLSLQSSAVRPRKISLVLRSPGVGTSEGGRGSQFKDRTIRGHRETNCTRAQRNGRKRTEAHVSPERLWSEVMHMSVHM